MTCDDARALFSALLDTEIADAEGLEAHLSACEACRREARRAALVDRLSLETLVEDRLAERRTGGLLRVARPSRPSTTAMRVVKTPRGGTAAIVLGSLAAAGVLAALAVYMILELPDPVPPVVTVTPPVGEIPPPALPAPGPVEPPRPVRPSPASPSERPAPKPGPARVETPPAPPAVAAPAAEPAKAVEPAPVARPSAATVAAAATLERGEGEVYVISADGQTRAKSGQPLYKGQGLQTLGSRSRALLTYADGTSVELRGETTVRDVVAGENEIVLSEGAVAVKAADHVVAISTPHAEAKAAASSLVLSVTDEGTQMRVLEGRAQWTRLADGVTFNVAAGAAPVWALAQDPKGPQAPAAAHPKVDQKKVDEAIKKGIAYLKGTNADSGRTMELVLWTYIHAGLSEDESHVKVPLDKMLAAPLSKTYNVALQAMILEKLDRVKHQKRVFHCGQFLVDNQWDYGQWGYGSPTNLPDPPKGVPTGDRPKVSTSGRKPGAVDFDAKAVRTRLPVTKQAHDPGSRGDDSNSQYAHLGLRACHDAGILFPAETLARADKWWRESQVGGAAKNNAGRPNVATGATGNYPPAGWGYFAEGKGGKGAATGSMTVGGLGALAILDYIQGKNWKADQDVVEAVNWVAANFSVTENPGRGATHHYYYLYGLERAGVLYGTEFFGTQEWYPLGANYLLENQKPDGSWAGGGKGDGPVDTCFAILFLKRATRPLQDVATEDARKPVPNK